MSYKVYSLDNLSPIEWSQAAWRLEGQNVSLDCDRELVHDVLLAHLPKDGVILDAGCGTAKWPMYLRRLGYRVLGIDISHDACAIAKRIDPRVDLVVADTRRTALRDHSVDAVVSLGVVEHEEAGPLEGLREIHRILRPNGLLILDVPFNNLLRRLVTNPLQSWVTRRQRRASWKLAFNEYRFTKRELRGFLAATGFEPLAVYPNDLLPPRNMGLWVDYQNLVFNPFIPPKLEQLFILPGLMGTIAHALIRWLPWSVCGEVTFVARARP